MKPADTQVIAIRTQQQRAANLQVQLTAQKEACDRAVAGIAELDQEAIDLNAAIENHNNAERELRERIAEIGQRFEAAEQTHLKAEIEADLRAKHETDRLAELTALKAKAEATAQQRTGQIAAL